MSCFIVSNETIGRIVQAAATKDKFDTPFGKVFDTLGYDLDLGEQLARDLFNLNVDAFCERYPADEDAPEGQRTRYPEDISEFEFTPATGKLDRAALIQVHKSAICLSYQCGEGDIPERPLYKALEEFIHRLESHIVISSSEWEEALWG